MYKRWNIKRISIVILLLMQLTLLLIYLITQEKELKASHNLESPVVFLKTKNNGTRKKNVYFTENSRVIIKTRNVDDIFEDFNTSLCYKYGTDIKTMRKSKNNNWKCVCLPNWHGNDCGQPEVIWRALLTLRKHPIVPAPRKTQRRLVYLTEVNAESAVFSEVALHELRDVADLFIVCNVDNTTVGIESRLRNGYLRDISDKILYIDGHDINHVWRKAKRIIKNLREDDIFFINNEYEVPNVDALKFLKLYDKWPEPLIFRLKWTVYGFFWRHPNKTALSSGLCTLRFLYEALDNDLRSLKSLASNNVLQKGLIIGDLNHFGGWFCQFCNNEPLRIIKSLKINLGYINSTVNVSINKKIDVPFIEDLIENGIYIDGKTALERLHRSRENYYAPNYVGNNNLKYDWLLMNLYSKMDYY